MLTVIVIIVFAYVVWLALYLLARDWSSLQLRYAGLGLLVYALMLAFDILREASPENDLLTRISAPLPLLLSAFWSLAIVHLLPEDHPLRQYDAVTLIIMGVFYLTWVLFEPPYLLLTGLVLIPLIESFVLLLRHNPQRRLLWLVTLFVGIGAGSLALQVDILPRQVVLLSISADLLIFGAVIALLDALDQGENLLPDFRRSLAGASLAAILFGGQVGVVILGSGENPWLYALLFSTLTLSITIQVFADPFQTALDKLALPPQIQQEREDLRTAASALPRVDTSLDMRGMEEEEFVRLTRRALSHMGNLPRLAASPLTQLPLIEQRLAARHAPCTTVERAAELKSLLIEHISGLKPRDGDSFGISDAWRYYNAVYYPYVMGLKPYSRQPQHAELTPEAREILTWFQGQVPERTLHNWQNAAARLIAQSLREHPNG